MKAFSFSFFNLSKMSCFNISFSGLFKMNINQQTLINCPKLILSSYAKLLFTEVPQVSLITIGITDTVIDVKTNIPKDEKGRVPLIIPFEYQ
jgi:hypothetical protein